MLILLAISQSMHDCICGVVCQFYVPVIPYMAKLSRGKTFVVVHKTHYSLGNFRGASGPCHYVLYTASDSRGKLLRLAKKQRKSSPSKVLPYMVLSKCKVQMNIQLYRQLPILSRECLIIENIQMLIEHPYHMYIRKFLR